MRPEPIQFVVFDAVGTLIYPDPDVATAYASVAQRYGSRLSRGEVAQRFRQAFSEDEQGARWGDTGTSESIERSRWRRIVRSVLADVERADDCFAELFAHFAQPESWRTFPDVSDALTGLRKAGVRIGIASNFDQRLGAIVNGLEPTLEVEFALASSEIGFRKPDERFFHAVIARAGVPAGQILYVGDDVENDFDGARIAG